MTPARSLLLGLSLLLCRAALAAPAPAMVVFFEPGFPAADTAPPSREALQALLPGASFADAGQLPARLARARLLVLPFGSAFPERAWEALHGFLARGGNLLVLGGKPFARPAFQEGTSWRLRPESGRFTRELLIDQYQTTPGSAGLSFEANADRPPALPPFAWTRAFSPLVHLSSKDLYARDGSTGALDARLDPLAWGSREGRRLAAPVIQIDHLQNRFAGGRWIFLAAELTDLTRAPVAALAAAAARGSEDFTVRPRLPLYLPGESVEVELHWKGAPGKATVELTARPQGGGPPLARLETRLPARRPWTFRAPAEKGLFVIEARLRVDGETRAIERTGFWMRDREWLRAGPKLSVDQDYFQLDGRPLAVVGTTYMASDVQRLFFERPNVFVWDRDLAALAADGLNMLRTGWWTGWDRICDARGRPTPRALRTLEAYLMAARRHGLPVQFTFFAFLPEVLGGESPYLDPKALARQRALVSAVSGDFHDVPFLAWDIINEPSFSKRLWSDRPAGDRFELAAWNAWLARRHPDRAALAQAWDVPSLPKIIPLPTDAAFDPRAAYSGRGSLALHDFYLFAQETFAGWLEHLRATIRATGSSQLVTVGQDEGGLQGRPSPVYFGKAVDFTTNHSWWQNDALVWDALLARQPGKPMLIQETGYQRELTLDQAARRDPQGEADLVACKMAAAFIEGAGSIQWLWHTNAFMTSGNEVSIGAVRADGTEKPEAAVMRDFARFARVLGPHLRAPERPPVAIVTSQAAQLSLLRDLQVAAQQASVRALVRDNHQPAFVLAETQLGALDDARLAILPSPQALTTAGWSALLAYVDAGGALLVTGAVERDESWHRAGRLHALFADGAVESLVQREGELHLGSARLPVAFSLKAQASLERVRFPDGASLREIPQGKGRIFWAALPVELAEGGEPARALYAHVLGRLGLRAPIEGTLPPGVLVHATLLGDAVLHVIISDRDEPTSVAFVDRTTHARVSLQLAAGRPALVLLRRSDGAVLARYGF